MNMPVLQDRSSRPKGILHDLKTTTDIHGLIKAIY